MTTLRQIILLLLTTVITTTGVDAEERPQQLNCDIGPIKRTYGKTEWLVYSCNDGRSLHFQAQSGSAAFPFFFFFYAVDKSDNYQLRGSGTGNKDATNAAFNDLKVMRKSDLEALIAETRRVQNKPPTAASSPQPTSPSLQEINVTTASEPGWLPSADQRAQIPQRTQEFLAMLDAGQYAKAYNLNAEGLKKLVPFEVFEKGATEFNKAAGSVKERRITKITWTKDPANAPAPGVYVAVDLESRFADIDRHCGYVMLYQHKVNEPFFIMRHEYSFLTNSQAREFERSKSKQVVDETWRKLSQHCPNYQGQLLK
jgi:Protein of unknown function (DUF4019)